MDQLEKAARRRPSAAQHHHHHHHRTQASGTSPKRAKTASSGAGRSPGRARATGLAAALDDEACVICGSDEVSNANSIVFCDLCDVAVHQVRWKEDRCVLELQVLLSQGS